MKLSKRLQLIADLVPQNSIIADIGCDHGKLLYYVLENFNAPFVFGSDISAKSVEKTQKLLSKKYENFKTIVSDGLSNYTKNELNLINCIVIAGMGGLEIVKILTNLKSDSLPNLKNLILQPQNNVKLVREWLHNNGYYIEFDKIILEKNIYYNVIKAKIGNEKQNLSQDDLEFGITNLKEYNADFESYLNYEINKLKNVVINTNSNKEEFANKLNKLQHILNAIKN